MSKNLAKFWSESRKFFSGIAERRKRKRKKRVRERERVRGEEELIIIGNSLESQIHTQRR